MKLTKEDKIKIVSKDYKIGRLEMLITLSNTLNKKSDKHTEKMALVRIGVKLGLLYQNSINVDVSKEYDSITEKILDMFELRVVYKELEER